MNRYDSYKDSGVEWIGEIPSYWGKGKLYQYSEMSNGSTPSRVKPEYWENGTIPWMSSGEINKKRIREIEGKITQEGFENSSTKLLPVGTVMMGLNGQGKTKGTVGILEIETTCNQSLCGMIFNDDINPTFGYYFLDSQYYHIRGLVGEGQREGISVSFLSRYPLLVPPLSEQQQIVSFLNTKTSLIDSLIEKTQRKIELLKEKRTSLINEVVTKGLNPNVEMKDSGVEWIGEIPNHWLFTKFNRFVFFQEGPGLRTFQFTDEGTKVICVTNITENGIDFTYKKFISTDEYFEKYQHFTVEKGDFLLSSSGNSWGKVSEYFDDEKVMLNTSTIRLNTLNSSKYNKSLIPHILKSEVVRKQLEILMTGSCQPNFGPSHLNQLVIPIPPLPEQQQIVEYLDEQTQKIDKTISIEEKRIELLKEYRQSLISEVVTGKRKVVE